MIISSKEIGLIKRMIDVYEKEVQQADIKDLIKNEELEELKALKLKIEYDIKCKKGKRGN